MSQAGKELYLVANIKSHKTLKEMLDWVEAFRCLEFMADNLQTIVCIPFPFIEPIYLKVHNQEMVMNLGVQDVSPFPYGAYTGAVAADMIKGWVKYAIVGHSERRRYFKETDQEVANKVSRCLEVGLTPIVCVDEPYLESQINTLETEQQKKCIYAYEPVSAIGSGHPDTPEHADKVAQRVQAQIRSEVPVLYGGSVNKDNVNLVLEQAHLRGVLVGTASLEADEWKALIK